MTKAITIRLPEIKRYGASELKKMIKKHTIRGVLVALSSATLLVSIVLINSALQYQVFLSPITAITSVLITLPSSLTQVIEKSIPIIHESGPIVVIQHGPAVRAGTPVGVIDALISEEDDNFADTDKLHIAGSTAGSGDMVDIWEDLPPITEVEVEKPIEAIPDPGVFVAYEKEGGISSLQDLISLVEYPQAAKNVGIEGTVLVQVLIGADGTPQKAQIQASDNSNLNKAAIIAVMSYQGYVPARQNQEAVMSWLSIPITFEQK